MGDIPRSLYTFFCQVDSDGNFVAPGEAAVSGSVALTDAGGLTALTAIATALGVAGDVAGANTVIGQLKQIAANTTP